MPNDFWQLTEHFAHLERKHIPASWATRPALGRYVTYRDVAIGARHCKTDLERSDSTIRALIEIAAEPCEREHSRLVLLVAIAPVLRSKLPAFTRTPGVAALEVTNDALVDLALVICAAGDLGHLDHLAYRLVNRTRTRMWKQHHKTTDQPAGTESDPTMADASARVDEQAIASVEVTEFRRAVQHSLDAGDITEATWATYRRCLGRRLCYGRQDRGPSGAERMRQVRATRLVDRAIGTRCEVHDHY